MTKQLIIKHGEFSAHVHVSNEGSTEWAFIRVARHYAEDSAMFAKNDEFRIEAYEPQEFDTEIEFTLNDGHIYLLSDNTAMLDYGGQQTFLGNAKLSFERVTSIITKFNLRLGDSYNGATYLTGLPNGALIPYFRVYTPLGVGDYASVDLQTENGSTLVLSNRIGHETGSVRLYTYPELDDHKDDKPIQVLYVDRTYDDNYGWYDINLIEVGPSPKLIAVLRETPVQLIVRKLFTYRIAR